METSTREKTRMVLEFFRLAGISGLIFIGTVLLVLLVMGWIYQDRIKTMLLDAFNKQLRTELRVADIRLELIRSFPLASLTLSHVTLMESGNHHPKDTLLQARRLQFQFKLADIIRKEYEIRQITLNQGFARLSYDQFGHSNFEFWEQDTGHGEPLHIDLQKLILNNMKLVYHHQQQKHLFDIDITRASLSRKHGADGYHYVANAELFASQIDIDSLVLLASQPMKIELGMLVDHNASCHIRKGIIHIDKHVFITEGSITKASGIYVLDTRISGKKILIQELISDLPVLATGKVSDYQPGGELTFQALIQGPFTRKLLPRIQADFELRRAELIHRTTGLRLRELSFTGNYDNGESQSPETSMLILKSLRTRLNNGHLKGNISISNFHQPYLEFDLYADMLASDMLSLLDVKNISDARGRVSMDIRFQGGMNAQKTFGGEDLVKARATGTISAQNLGFAIRNGNLLAHGLNGSLLFHENDLMVESFSGNIGKSDFDISGYFRNVLPYLFLPGEPIQVDASLHARQLNLDELLQDNTSEADTTYRLEFSDRLGFYLRASIEELSFRRFSASDLSGTISLQNKRLYAQDINFRAMDGLIGANGYIDGGQPEVLVTGCHAVLKKVDVHQLFYQMGNFGQTSILDENIFGIISSELRFNSDWTPSLEIDWGSLETDARIRVEDGVLVDYEPMNALGNFLRIDDLSRVTFSTLENIIRIKDRKITIPQMEINSNVLNLKLAGEHTFENQIDYYLQVLLSDILARKNRERRNPQEQYGDIIDDGLGRTTLFLRVTGHISDPVFRYDAQGVRQKIRDDLRQERENLRDIMRREFPFLTKPAADSTDSVPLNKRQREMRRIREQEEGKIIFEWDEI